MRNASSDFINIRGNGLVSYEYLTEDLEFNS